MRTVKVIAGLGCIVATLFLAPFAWVSFVYGNLWFKFVPVVFILGLVAIGVFLILKRRLALSKNAKTLITVFISVLTVSLIMVDVYIRCDRKALQNRAREFLSRPVPTMLETNSID